MEKSIPLISILTTTRNALALLPSTFASIKSQTFTDFEHIIKDAQSTDGTVSWLERNASHFAYWESTSDTGIYDALNIALSHCTGTWTYVLHAGDTLYDSTTLEKISPILKNTPADIVYGAVYLHKNNRIPKLVPAKPLWYLPYGIIGSHQAIFMRTSVLKKYLFDTAYKIAADYDLLFKLRKNNHSFERTTQIIANYDGNGYSSTRLEQNYQEKKIIARKYAPYNIFASLFRLQKRLRSQIKLRERFVKNRQ